MISYQKKKEARTIQYTIKNILFQKVYDQNLIFKMC